MGRVLDILGSGLLYGTGLVTLAGSSVLLLAGGYGTIQGVLSGDNTLAFYSGMAISAGLMSTIGSYLSFSVGNQFIKKCFE